MHRHSRGLLFRPLLASRQTVCRIEGSQAKGLQKTLSYCLFARHDSSKAEFLRLRGCLVEELCQRSPTSTRQTSNNPEKHTDLHVCGAMRKREHTSIAENVSTYRHEITASRDANTVLRGVFATTLPVLTSDHARTLSESFSRSQSMPEKSLTTSARKSWCISTLSAPFLQGKSALLASLLQALEN